MWVKLTLPPRARRRWLFITTRLSAMSLAGTARTLVAVGRASDASMLPTTLPAAPRIGVLTSSRSSSAAGGAGVADRAGVAGGRPSSTAGVRAAAGAAPAVVGAGVAAGVPFDDAPFEDAPFADAPFADAPVDDGAPVDGAVVEWVGADGAAVAGEDDPWVAPAGAAAVGAAGGADAGSAADSSASGSTSLSLGPAGPR